MNAEIAVVGAGGREESAVLRRTNSLAELSATEFLRLLARREISVLDYAKACADRIEQFDPVLKAWKCFDRALFEARARKVDTKLSGAGPKGRIAGVPVGIKDIFNTYDMPTGMGSPILENYSPGNDARVVSNIRLEDGIVAGKTVTAEFAVHHPGPTVNPYDPQRSPGTSSSGSAAAVAARMVPVALASQTAGSTIRPASYCGVAGFKPSFGLIPRTGVLKTTDTLDSIGIMGRTVADLRLVFDVIRVRGHNYPISEAALADPVRQSMAGRALRVGVLRGPKSHLEEPTARAAFETIVALLPGYGIEVVEFALPPAFGEAHDVHETIYRRALSYYFKMEWGARKDLFSPWLQEMIDGGLAITSAAYHAACQRQTELARLLDGALLDVDVVIGLATADVAPANFYSPDPPDHSLIWTMCGVPAISLPLLTGREGLPVGVQIVARRFGDYRLLNFAELLERIAPEKW